MHILTGIMPLQEINFLHVNDVTFDNKDVNQVKYITPAGSAIAWTKSTGIPQPTTTTPTQNSTVTWTWQNFPSGTEFEIKVDGNLRHTDYTSTVYQETNLTENASHTIGIRARRKLTGEYSDWSATGSHTVVIDTFVEKPTPSTVSPTPTAATFVQWQWSAITDVTDPVTYEVSMDGAIVATNELLTYTQLNLTAGAHTISVVAIDGLGNRSDPGTSTIIVDRTGPPVPTPTLVTTAYTNDAYAVVTASDELRWEWPAVSDPYSSPVTYDILIFEHSGSPYDGLSRESSWTQVHSHSDSDVSYTWDVPADGRYKIKIRSSDALGNKSEYYWEQYYDYGVIVDTSVPNVPVPTTNYTHTDNQWGIFTNQVRPTWTWTSVPGNPPHRPKGELYQVDFHRLGANDVPEEAWGSEWLEAGSYTPPVDCVTGTRYKIRVRARNHARTESPAWGEQLVNVDLIPPSQPVVSTNATETDQTQVWNWTSTNTGVGNTIYEVTLKNTDTNVLTQLRSRADGNVNPTITTNITDAGSYQLIVVAIDSQGNESTPGISATYTPITIADLLPTPPQVEIWYPAGDPVDGTPEIAWWPNPGSEPWRDDQRDGLLGWEVTLVHRHTGFIHPDLGGYHTEIVQSADVGDKSFHFGGVGVDWNMHGLDVSASNQSPTTEFDTLASSVLLPGVYSVKVRGKTVVGWGQYGETEEFIIPWPNKICVSGFPSSGDANGTYVAIYGMTSAPTLYQNRSYFAGHADFQTPVYARNTGVTHGIGGVSVLIWAYIGQWGTGLWTPPGGYNNHTWRFAEGPAPDFRPYGEADWAVHGSYFSLCQPTPHFAPWQEPFRGYAGAHNSHLHKDANVDIC